MLIFELNKYFPKHNIQKKTNYVQMRSLSTRAGQATGAWAQWPGRVGRGGPRSGFYGNEGEGGGCLGTPFQSEEGVVGSPQPPSAAFFLQKIYKKEEERWVRKGGGFVGSPPREGMVGDTPYLRLQLFFSK